VTLVASFSRACSSRSLSGDGPSAGKANWGIEVISYNASSCAGTLTENQFCNKLTRSIASNDKAYDRHRPLDSAARSARPTRYTARSAPSRLGNTHEGYRRTRNRKSSSDSRARLVRGWVNGGGGQHSLGDWCGLDRRAYTGTCSPAKVCSPPGRLFNRVLKSITIKRKIFSIKMILIVLIYM